MAEEVKNIEVISDKKNETISRYVRFGWKSVGSSEPTGNVFNLSFVRDKKMPNYKRLNKLEKQYVKINRPFPIAGFVGFVLGLGLFIAGLLVEMDIVKISLVVVGLFILCVGLFAVLTFLFIKIKKKDLIEDLLSQADELTGLTLLAPLPGNIKEHTPDTYEIKNGDIKLGK